jgi:glycosyltransferase involved in cell wall biosynthesis
VHAGKETICMFTPTADGGHARYSMELLRAMSNPPRDRWQVELVSSEDLHDEFKSDQYPVHAILPRIRQRSTFPNRLAWVLNRLMHYPRRELTFLRWLRTQEHITGVHFQEWTPWLAARVFRRIHGMGKKAFYTVHNIVPHKYPKFVPKAVIHWWIRRACRQADGLFVHTEPLAQQLDRFLGPQPRGPIHVVPHGVWTVDHGAAHPSLHERLAWKKLLFFGTMRRNKGLDLLLRAAEQLPGYSITIAGEPVDKDYFNDEILPLVRRLQAAGVKIDLRARFTPEEEVGPLFASHSAIILPYTANFMAQSGVVYLALAHELPVVASEAGGLRDLFREFKIGETFVQHTPEALASAVHALEKSGSDSQLNEQFRLAKRRYSWQQSAGATIAGYAAAFAERVPVDALPEEIEPRRATNDRTVEPTTAH